VADTLQGVVLVARTGINVDTDSRKVARECFGRNADAIRKRGDLVELNRILKQEER
jgi:hypothetical protein